MRRFTHIRVYAINQTTGQETLESTTDSRNLGDDEEVSAAIAYLQNDRNPQPRLRRRWRRAAAAPRRRGGGAVIYADFVELRKLSTGSLNP